LADLLRPFGIRPKSLRHGDDVDKGYKRSDFKDAWSRYLKPEADPIQTHPGTPVTPVTAVTIPNIPGVAPNVADFEAILAGQPI